MSRQNRVRMPEVVESTVTFSKKYGENHTAAFQIIDAEGDDIGYAWFVDATLTTAGISFPAVIDYRRQYHGYDGQIYTFDKENGLERFTDNRGMIYMLTIQNNPGFSCEVCYNSRNNEWDSFEEEEEEEDYVDYVEEYMCLSYLADSYFSKS
jgi:hypothetical protein